MPNYQPYMPTIKGFLLQKKKVAPLSFKKNETKQPGKTPHTFNMKACNWYS